MWCPAPKLGLGLVLMLVLASVSAEEENFYQCQPLVLSPGVLIPRRDVFVPVGSEPILFHCHLDPSHNYFANLGVRARDLQIDVAYLHDEAHSLSLETKVINETTVEAALDPVEATEAVVTCKARLNGDNTRGVCQTRVFVGEPPGAPLDFKCVSENWQNLNCTWREPHNFVKTSYELFYQAPGRHRATSCCKNSSTCHLVDAGHVHDSSLVVQPALKTVLKSPFPLTIELCRANPLGLEASKIVVQVAMLVRPNPPEELKLSSLSPSSVLVYFRIPRGLEHFAPGLIMSLSYKSEFDKIARTLKDRVFAKDQYEHEVTIEGLSHYTMYEVQVRLRSAIADPKDEDLWSWPSSSAIRTLPSAPSRPPLTTVGSFEVEMNGLQSRRIFVYWQRLQEREHNGPGFRYEVMAVSKARNELDSPSLLTSSYALFPALPLQALRFNLSSVNNIGRSNVSSLFVGAMSELRQLQPRAITRIAYNEHLFELSWIEPVRSHEVTGYTVFWCRADDKRDRPYQCEGDLEWQSVESSQLSLNISVDSGATSVYQFAVAASTHSNLSSGMVWATCTILHSKVINRMSTVSIDVVKQRSMKIRWRLECADRVGIVVGFKVVYCSIDDSIEDGPNSAEDSRCKDEENFVKVGADVNNVWIDDLRPWTTYKVSVAVLSRAGEGELSDPLLGRTLIDRPDSPPVDLKAELISSNGVSLAWKPPLLPNGPIDHYRIEVRHNSHDERLKQQHYNTSGTSYVLRELKFYKDYYFKVGACNSRHDINEPLCSKRSAEQQIRSRIGPSGVMEAPSVTFVNGSRLHVNLDTSFDAGGPIERFELQMTHSEARSVFQMKARNKNQVIDLDSVHKSNCANDSITNVYNFSIRAVTFDAKAKQRFFSPWSPSRTVYGYCSDGVPWLAIGVVVIVVPLAVVIITLYVCRCLSSYKQTNVMFKEVQKELIVLNDHSAVDNEKSKHWKNDHNDDEDSVKENRKHNYNRALSKDSMETLLSVGKRRREGSETTSGCESARSSEVEEGDDKQQHRGAASGTTKNATPENGYLRRTTNKAVDNTSSSYVMARPLANVGEEELQDEMQPQVPNSGGYVAFESLCNRAPSSTLRPNDSSNMALPTNKGYISLAQVNGGATEPQLSSNYVCASPDYNNTQPTTGYISAQPSMSSSLSAQTLPASSATNLALARSSLV